MAQRRDSVQFSGPGEGERRYRREQGVCVCVLGGGGGGGGGLDPSGRGGGKRVKNPEPSTPRFPGLPPHYRLPTAHTLESCRLCLLCSGPRTCDMNEWMYE